MTAKKKPSASKKRQKTAKAEPLELRYELAELPTSQHRAGLAGLVLSVQWMHEQLGMAKGVCEVVDLVPHGATLRVDQPGLDALFDTIYKAAAGTTAQPSPRKKNGQVVEPQFTEERVTVDKKGKEVRKTFYHYPTTIPDGAFLAAWDPSGDGKDGLWIKLWRDMLWQIVRGVPAQRKPYNDRLEGAGAQDATKVFSGLKDPQVAVPQPSTYLLGAQETTADNVSFRDRARLQLLLHFWPLVTQVYKPVSWDRDGKRVDHGYALAIPDVADLELFCEELPPVLRERPSEKSGYLPRAAVVDLAVESALSSMAQLDKHIRNREAGKGAQDLVSGMDVIHAQKDGNNVRIRGQSRVEPQLDLREYQRLREGYWSPLFRAQRVANYLDGAPWYRAMDRVMTTHSWDQTIDARHFRHDAREAFEHMESTTDGLEQMVLRVVSTYINRKLATKYELEWSAVKDNEQAKGEYSKKRAAVARDAFLAVRSRTGSDFIEYFAATLCSTPQHLEDASYLQLSRELLSDPEKTRTLTLLALSAKG